MREKRYSKGMKGTQEEEKESYPYFDIYPLEREVIKKYNQDDRYAFKARIRVTEDVEEFKDINSFANCVTKRSV